MPRAGPCAARSDLLTRLDQTLFPGGDKAGWWLMCVQLDPEFKRVVKRAAKPPVRLNKA